METEITSPRPLICSLQKLEIELHEDIRNHLANQYNSDEKDDCNHFECILSAMKRPPSFTTCRVNLIRATRHVVLTKLQSLLFSIPQLEVLEDPDFHDVINIVPTNYQNSSGTKSQTSKAYQKMDLSSQTDPDRIGEKKAFSREAF